MKFSFEINPEVALAIISLLGGWLGYRSRRVIRRLPDDVHMRRKQLPRGED